MQEKLDGRGGSKKESVYDIIRRKKRKMRVQRVLDQKANSVADLAAVLLGQEKGGEDRAEAQGEERGRDRGREVKEMLKLAEEARKGGLQWLEAEKEVLRPVLEREEVDGEDSTTAMSRTRAKRAMYALKRRKQLMEFSVHAVAEAQPAKAAQLEREARLAEAEQKSLDEANNASQAARTKAQEAAKAHDVATQAAKDAVAQRPRSEAQRAMGGKYSQIIAEVKEEVARKHRVKDLRGEIKELGEKILRLGEAREGEEGGVLMARLEACREVNWTMKWQRKTVGAGKRAERMGMEAKTAVDDAAKLRAEVRAAQKARWAAGVVDREARMAALLNSEGVRGIEKAAPSIDYHALLPSLPRNDDPSNLPKRGQLRQKLQRLSAPVFATQGVKVKWNNVLDAEFAEAWPADVVHEAMGVSRHTAPRPEAEAVLDAGGVRERGAFGGG